MYLVDCDADALELARENVEMLEEEELIGRHSEEGDADEGGGGEEEGGCLGVELIMAKVNYQPPKRNNNQGRGGGRGNRGGAKGGRGKRGRGGRVNTAPQQHDTSTLYNNPNNNDDDGIPLPRKIVDTVITVSMEFSLLFLFHLDVHKAYTHRFPYNRTRLLEQRTMKGLMSNFLKLR